MGYGMCVERSKNCNQPHRPTVQQLIDEHKVVLDVLLRDLAEVGLHDTDDLEEELKHHGCIDILLCDGREPDVGSFDVEETRACNVCDRRAHLLACMNHVHSECVNSIPPANIHNNTLHITFLRSDMAAK